MGPCPRVMFEDYGIPELNAIVICKWRTRLCAAASSKTFKPFFVPGATPRLPLRLPHVLPAVPKLFPPKYSQFARRLDLAVGDAPMEGLTRRSPTRAELKSIGRQLREVEKQAEEGRAAIAAELDKSKAQLATKVRLLCSKLSEFSSQTGSVVGSVRAILRPPPRPSPRALFFSGLRPTQFEKEKNKPETCLFMLLGSLEIVAATRYRAIIHIVVTAPMRFFANDIDLGYLPANMGLVLDAL